MSLCPWLAVVDAVEIDPVVVRAAVGAMGLPATLPNLRLHTADAARFVADAAAGVACPPAAGAGGPSEGGGEGRWYDLVAMDVFDGKDEVPAALRTPGARRWCDPGGSAAAPGCQPRPLECRPLRVPLPGPAWPAGPRPWAMPPLLVGPGPCHRSW